MRIKTEEELRDELTEMKLKFNRFFLKAENLRIQDLEETNKNLQNELKYRDTFEDMLIRKIEEVELQLEQIKSELSRSDRTECKRCDGIGYFEGCADDKCSVYILRNIEDIIGGKE